MTDKLDDEKLEAHRALFRSLCNPEAPGHENFALMTGTVNGEPTSMIVSVFPKAEGGHAVFPLFVSITPSMKLTDDEGVDPNQGDVEIKAAEFALVDSNGESKPLEISEPPTAAYFRHLLASEIVEVQITEGYSLVTYVFSFMNIVKNPSGLGSGKPNPSIPAEVAEQLGGAYYGPYVVIQNGKVLR